MLKHGIPGGIWLAKIIIMINNNTNLSCYTGTPPSDGQSRNIKGGPIYTHTVVAGLSKKGAVTFWTKDAGVNACDLNLDTRDVAHLITIALDSGKFLQSEWCQNSSGMWVACDSYRVSQLLWNVFARKDLRTDYYLKFAVNRKKTNLLSVSNHVS
jgi:hypothetical protein